MTGPATIGIVLAALVTSHCSRIARNVIEHNEATRMLPRFAVCPDRQPIRLLINEHCPGGVCGYSCLPGRWDGPNGRIDQCRYYSSPRSSLSSPP